MGSATPAQIRPLPVPSRVRRPSCQGGTHDGLQTQQQTVVADFRGAGVELNDVIGAANVEPVLVEGHSLNGDGDTAAPLLVTRQQVKGSDPVVALPGEHLFATHNDRRLDAVPPHPATPQLAASLEVQRVDVVVVGAEDNHAADHCRR